MLHVSLGARLGLVLIRGYKLAFSPYFRGSCRFLPSCADYAAEAIASFGLLRGSWLAARRLARCHPLCASGYDPVPANPGGREGFSEPARRARSRRKLGPFQPVGRRKPLPTPSRAV